MASSTAGTKLAAIKMAASDPDAGHPAQNFGS